MEAQLAIDQVWIKTEPDGEHGNDKYLTEVIKMEPFEQTEMEHNSSIFENMDSSFKVQNGIEEWSQQTENGVNCAVTAEPLQEEDTEYVVVYCIKEEPDIIEDPEMSAKQCFSNNSIENDIVQVCHNAVPIKEEIESDHETERENTDCIVNDFVVVKLEDHTSLVENFTNRLQAKRSRRIKEKCTRSKSENAYKCDICGEYLSELKGLKNHLLTHAKSYTCYQCGDRFSEAASLKIHYEMHSTTKPFKCTDCDKSYAQYCELNSHSLVHKKRPRKPYKCDQCYRRFTYKAYLKIHVLGHSDTKVHKCVECGKGFSRFRYLKTHALTHSRTKPHRCEECGKCFTQSSHLKYHSRIHSGEKPYKCAVCGKCFRACGTLKTHLTTHSV